MTSLLALLLLAAAASAGLSAPVLLLVALLVWLGSTALLEWNRRRWDRRFRGSQVEEIIAWLE